MVWMIALIGMVATFAIQVAIHRLVHSAKAAQATRRLVFFLGAAWRLKNPKAAARVTRQVEWENEWMGGSHA